MPNSFVTCEQVRAGHPDKFCDQIADAILDAALRIEGADVRRRVTFPTIRTGIEVMAKDHVVIVSGEIRFSADVARNTDIDALVRQKWDEVGYPDSQKVEVINQIRDQQPELQASSDLRGAGDQGIMIGFATRETPQYLPLEFVLSTRLCQRMDSLFTSGQLPWLRADGKAQVTISPSGEVTRVVVGVQHTPIVYGLTDPPKIWEILHHEVVKHIVEPVLGTGLDRQAITINGTGSFTIGGPLGDAGVLGRKIVADAYGPSVPVGGGAFSGKDPTKVDRSAAYMARMIALVALTEGDPSANSVTVRLAYAIGSHQPEMVVGLTDTGVDLSAWIRHRFSDLSPSHIADRLDLWRISAETTWRYQDTAVYGHFGRKEFPWEAVHG
jgi:S-adenosylmethionine synthetase